jgi:metal-responsive CopG/Arc/MetJ family transcriptional regulator
MPKKVLIALPHGLLEQVDMVAQVEHRNRSDLVREALRRYIDEFKRSQSGQLNQGATIDKLMVLSSNSAE